MKNVLLAVICVSAVTVVACSSASAPPAEESAAAPAAGAAAAPTSSAAKAPAPAAAPRARMREVTVPAGTTLTLTLETAVASDTSKVEDAVKARLAKAVVVGGATVLPAGAEATGTVLQAEGAGRVSGRSMLSVGFDRIRAGSTSYTVHTAAITKEGASSKGKDAAKVGIGAGAGALIGAVAGGKKGALIGTAVGAGAGTTAAVATKGEEVSLAEGTEVETTLDQPLKIQVAE